MIRFYTVKRPQYFYSKIITKQASPQTASRLILISQKKPFFDHIRTFRDWLLSFIPPIGSRAQLPEKEKIYSSVEDFFHHYPPFQDPEEYPKAKIDRIIEKMLEAVRNTYTELGSIDRQSFLHMTREDFLELVAPDDNSQIHSILIPLVQAFGKTNAASSSKFNNKKTALDVSIMNLDMAVDSPYDLINSYKALLQMLPFSPGNLEEMNPKNINSESMESSSEILQKFEDISWDEFFQKWQLKSVVISFLEEDIRIIDEGLSELSEAEDVSSTMKEYLENSNIQWQKVKTKIQIFLEKLNTK
ncbi:MAG: hypothetical protein SFU25_03160 [Candidatus Caenarcaniphilales bacterium]|nr:hypothetical protein [Candidatus Caenarcaniphilales bacterium]